MISKELLDKYSVANFSMLDYNVAWFLPDDAKEQYYLDLLCNLYVKNVFAHYNNNVVWNVDKIHTLLYECLKPHDIDYDIVAKAKTKEANRKRCYNCSWFERCKEVGKIDNCAAFVPK